MQKKRKLLLAFLVLGIIGLGIYLVAGFLPQGTNVVSTGSMVGRIKTNEKKLVQYVFIKPLLESEANPQLNHRSLAALRSRIKASIRSAKVSKKAIGVSLYFCDLKSGNCLGIDEYEKISDSTILEIPIAITAFKMAMRDSLFLSKKICCKKNRNKNEPHNKIIDSDREIDTNCYTVEDLIEKMISYSDVEAKQMLWRYLDTDSTAKAASEMGVNVSNILSKDFISVKNFSEFFRLLYKANYLDKKMFEQALTVLSKTAYDRGIVKGIPKGTLIAHKFGERVYNGSTHERQIYTYLRINKNIINIYVNYQSK